MRTSIDSGTSFLLPMMTLQAATESSVPARGRIPEVLVRKIASTPASVPVECLYGGSGTNTRSRVQQRQRRSGHPRWSVRHRGLGPRRRQPCKENTDELITPSGVAAMNAQLPQSRASRNRVVPRLRAPSPGRWTPIRRPKWPASRRRELFTGFTGDLSSGRKTSTTGKTH